MRTKEEIYSDLREQVRDFPSIADGIRIAASLEVLLDIRDQLTVLTKAVEDLLPDQGEPSDLPDPEAEYEAELGKFGSEASKRKKP